MDTYSEIGHGLAHVYHFLSTTDVYGNGEFYFLVKTHRGGNVKNYRNFANQKFLVFG